MPFSRAAISLSSDKISYMITLSAKAAGSLPCSRSLAAARQNTADAAVRRAYGVLCGAVGIAINLLLFALKLLAVVIGAILYYIVIQVVLWLGLNTNDLKMLQALVVAMFLAVPYWKNRYFKKKGGANHG